MMTGERVVIMSCPMAIVAYMLKNNGTGKKFYGARMIVLALFLISCSAACAMNSDIVPSVVTASQTYLLSHPFFEKKEPNSGDWLVCNDKGQTVVCYVASLIAGNRGFEQIMITLARTAREKLSDQNFLTLINKEDNQARTALYYVWMADKIGSLTTYHTLANMKAWDRVVLLNMCDKGAFNQAANFLCLTENLDVDLVSHCFMKAVTVRGDKSLFLERLLDTGLVKPSDVPRKLPQSMNEFDWFMVKRECGILGRPEATYSFSRVRPLRMLAATVLKKSRAFQVPNQTLDASIAPLMDNDFFCELGCQLLFRRSGQLPRVKKIVNEKKAREKKLVREMRTWLCGILESQSSGLDVAGLFLKKFSTQEIVEAGVVVHRVQPNDLRNHCRYAGALLPLKLISAVVDQPKESYRICNISRTAYAFLKKKYRVPLLFWIEDYKMVVRLLEGGADFTIKTPRNGTILHYAAKKCNGVWSDDIVHYLIRTAQVCLLPDEFDAFMTHRDAQNQMARHYASKSSPLWFREFYPNSVVINLKI